MRSVSGPSACHLSCLVGVWRSNFGVCTGKATEIKVLYQRTNLRHSLRRFDSLPGGRSSHHQGIERVAWLSGSWSVPDVSARVPYGGPERTRVEPWSNVGISLPNTPPASPGPPFVGSGGRSGNAHGRRLPSASPLSGSSQHSRFEVGSNRSSS